MAIKASPATGNINASGRVTAAEFAAGSVSAFRVGNGTLVEQSMPTTESSSKPISITGIVQWVRGLIGSFYTKPSGGIPKSDLTAAVQTSLGKADAAQPKIDDLNTIRERAKTGNEHAGIKDGNPHNTKFSDLAEKPTTLTGYGLTAVDPATVSAEGGSDDNKAADAVKTKQYVEYMVGSNTARFQGEFATADDIPTDVTQYATKTAPTNNDYIVVRDMSEYGKTGNLFSAIDAEVGSINANGVIDTAMTNFRHTTLLPLSGKDGWHVHLKATGVGGSAMFRLHAYKPDGSWNGQIAVAQSTGGMVELSGLVPYGTEGFRVSYLNGSSVTVFAHEREGAWRWIYTGEWSKVGKNGWSPAFQMSTEPLTPSQMDALNSGITEKKVSEIDNKRGKTDLAVYEVVRTENTDWTIANGRNLTEEFLSEVAAAGESFKPYFYDGYWFLPQLPNFRSDPQDFPGTYDRDVLTISGFFYYKIGHITDEINFDFTRPRYIDETLGDAKANEQLASRDTTAAQGTLVKFGPDGKLVAATASDIPHDSTKRDKTDNICAKDEYGDWVFTTDRGQGGKYSIVERPVEESGVISFYEYDLYIDNVLSDHAESVDAYRLTHIGEGQWQMYREHGVEATRHIIAKATESYVTPTGVRNIVSSDTETRNAITGLAEAATTYKIVDVPASGELIDKAINRCFVENVTVPHDFSDLIIRASLGIEESLKVTMPNGVGIWGDSFPADGGKNYLVTITRVAPDEAFVKTIELEAPNA